MGSFQVSSDEKQRQRLHWSGKIMRQTDCIFGFLVVVRLSLNLSVSLYVAKKPCEQKCLICALIATQDDKKAQNLRCLELVLSPDNDSLHHVEASQSNGERCR
jgi:hypothetical protein